jgi:hypothetical protein
LVKNPANYPFSSYQGIIGIQPTILNRNQVLEWFDGKKNFIDYHSSQFQLDSEDMLEDD